MTALCAAATAHDPFAGANALVFLAIQIHDLGHSADALAMLHAGQWATHCGPRMRALLHFTFVRALAKIPRQKTACLRELDTAREAYTQVAAPSPPANSSIARPESEPND